MIMITYFIIYPQSLHSTGEIIVTIELLIMINRCNLLHKFPVNHTRIRMRVSLKGTLLECTMCLIDQGIFMEKTNTP